MSIGCPAHGLSAARIFISLRSIVQFYKCSVHMAQFTTNFLLKFLGHFGSFPFNIAGTYARTSASSAVALRQRRSFPPSLEPRFPRQRMMRPLAPGMVTTSSMLSALADVLRSDCRTLCSSRCTRHHLGFTCSASSAGKACLRKLRASPKPLRKWRP